MCCDKSIETSGKITSDGYSCVHSLHTSMTQLPDEPRPAHPTIA